MISTKEAIAGAVLGAAVGLASIGLITWLAISGINEAHDVAHATRVAHDETRVDLAECRKQVNSATN